MAAKPWCPVPLDYLEKNFVKKGADTSWVGYYVMDASLDTEAKVIAKFGGTHWKPLSVALGMYQWLRTDAATPKSAYLGYVVRTTADVDADDLSDIYGGVDWELIYNEDGVKEFVCTNYLAGRSETLPAYAGMIISSPNLPDALSVQAKYGSSSTWVLLSDEDGMYQWLCSTYTAILTTIPSEIGDIIRSTTLTTLAQVQARYGGNWQLLSDEDGVYQWERIS